MFKFTEELYPGSSFCHCLSFKGVSLHTAATVCNKNLSHITTRKKIKKKKQNQKTSGVPFVVHQVKVLTLSLYECGLYISGLAQGVKDPALPQDEA